MELVVKINITELLDKGKELDLAKLLEFYQYIKAGKEIKLLNGMVKVQKIETVVPIGVKK